MEVILEGDPKEIAALVLAVQERQNLAVSDDAAIKDIAKAIGDIRPEAPETSDN